MNIVEFWENQTQIWNDENKCGFCWEYGAPMTEANLNMYQSKSDGCCVHLFLTRPILNGVFEYRVPPYKSSTKCQWIFTLYAVLPSSLGINNYNEISGHPLQESQWKTIFEPLLNCLGCDVILDECEANGNLFQINQWRMEQVFNYQNLNYTGWKISAIFQEEE